jgi:hypothetical protein
MLATISGSIPFPRFGSACLGSRPIKSLPEYLLLLMAKLDPAIMNPASPAEGDDDVRFYFFIGGVMHNAKAALACRRVQ